jgi:4-carboxymuconolactone decarboxylase
MRRAAKVGFASKTSDGRFIGPFSPLLRSPDIALTFLQLQFDEAKHTSLSERVREVVILSVGSVWKAPYELYAHEAVARDAGLSSGCVEALAAGDPCRELAADEEVAQRLTLALTAGRAIDDHLYTEALRQFGEKGLVDLAILAGCYQLVCGLLNVFAIPAPETGTDRLSEEI